MLPARAIRMYSFLIVCGFLLTGNLEAQKQLDSIVTYYYHSGNDSVNGVKTANEFNGAGRMTSHSIYFWNGRWDGWSFPCEECSVNAGRYEYVYDEKGTLLSTGGFVWMGPAVGWVQRTKWDLLYDDNGNNVLGTAATWHDDIKKWTGDVTLEYGYDNQGRIISRIANLWSQALNTWLPMEQLLFAYDNEGRKTEEVRQDWVDSSKNWVYLNKTEWDYDTAGIRTDIVYWKWSLINNNYTWKENGRNKIEYVFDSAGNKILRTDSEKVSATRWTPYYKEEVTYSHTGKPVLSVISKRFTALTEYLRTERAYDAADRLILETVTGNMERRPGPLAINDKLKVIRSFDFDGDITREIWYYWDGESKSYLSDGKDYYFYHETSTACQEQAVNPIRIFPNPTNRLLNLSGLTKPADVKIYSLQGMLLRRIPAVERFIDLSGLPAGGYLILVSEAGQPPFRTLLIKE